MTTIPFEPNRFRSTAVYYARHRIPYPDDLVLKVAARAGLAAGHRMLDLGCGPGQLAITFARLAGADATAMDPEPEMLAAAKADAQSAGVEIAVRQGSSYDLGPDLGRLRLTVMGRSFHWMDRPATLAALDALTEKGGAVALFGDRHIQTSHDWRKTLHDLSGIYSPERNADRERRRGPNWAPHEALLIHSPFSQVERISVFRERSLCIDDIVGRAFSMSVTSPQALGEKTDAFEKDLRTELASLSADGSFSEIVEISAVMAFRGE